MQAAQDKPKRCGVCHGWGYIPCDCICGYGDEDYEECEGFGFLWPDDDSDDWRVS